MNDLDNKNKMILSEKYNLYKNIFFKDFVDQSMEAFLDKKNAADLSIPFEYITYSKGKPIFGYMGDGSINLSYLALYLDSFGIDKSIYINKLDKRIEKLVESASNIYDAPFMEKGFFIRDDVNKSYNETSFTSMTSLLGLYGQNEDVCHSAFVSHD